MWQLVTSVKKEEQAIIVLLESLDCNSKAEKAVSELTVNELNTSDGMNILFGKLDIVFQSETIDEAYNTYSKFINYKQNEDEDINDYIIEYEHLYKGITDFDMKLTDPVLAFTLLDGAYLTDDDRKLALALGNDMKFENMKSHLKHLFSKTKSHNTKTDGQFNLKEEEEVYFTKNKFRGKHFGKYSQNEKKLYPLNKIGKVSRCLICDSKMHRADQCPHNGSNAAALVTEADTESDPEHCESAVIDTGCTKTVAGQIWFENFKSNLTENTLKETETFPSNTSFKFGDGRKVKSSNGVIFPVEIANRHCKINAKVVWENIPLLLSKTSLKKCGTIINMNEDKTTIFREEVVLHQSTSGHYCIDILPTFTTDNTCQKVLVLETDLPYKEKLSQITKIHKQFGHASYENMEKLLKNANMLDNANSKIIKEVVAKCSTCLKFKRPMP